ncbi:MAG: ANTAR domain-containing protein, partial [Actinomycetales bacterium]
DLAQYELGEGPCVDAATDLRSSVSGSVGHDGRWPLWGPAAEALGVRSVLSADMHGRDRRIGALNLYSTSEDVFTRESVEIAKVLADQSAAVMAAMRAEEGMRAALETRTVIGQAQGMLMERFGLDASQAFSVLRRFSQDNNIRLVDVAGQLVSTRAIP